MESISVIIPTKNRRELLTQTLDNILAQTMPADEIIVVYNDSSDGTYEHVRRRYRDSVIIVKNPGNQSPGGSRNYGLSIATGKYIQFFDSDDFMTKNKFEVQASVLGKTGSPMVYGPFVFVSVEDNGCFNQQDVVIQYRPIPENKTLRECMVRGFFTVIPGCLFRRSFVDQLGKWREDITAYEDWDYLWRISGLCDRPAHSNACAMFYRLHPHQITGNVLSEVSLDSTARDRDKIKAYIWALENNGGLSAAEKKFISALILFTVKFLKHLPEYNALYMEYNTPTNRLALQYLFTSNLIGKLITRSKWNLMRGITRSKAVYEHYLSLMP